MSIFGGAKHISFGSSITLSLGEARVLVLNATAGSLTVTLPTGTVTGGPYFYIFAATAFTLADPEGEFTDSLAANTLVTVMLVSGPGRVWERTQRTGGTLQADLRPAALGYTVSGAGNRGTISPANKLRSYSYLADTWSNWEDLLLEGGSGVGNAFASLGSDIYGIYPRASNWPVTNNNFKKAQKYTALTNTWAEVAEKTTPYVANQAASADSKVYFFGETEAGLAAGTVTPCEYDPADDTWNESWNNPEHMHIYGAAVAYSDLIYLYSGVAKDSAGVYSGITKKINSFDPTTGASGTWSTALTESTNVGMMFIGSAEHAGVLYFAGGCPLTATSLPDYSTPVTTHHSFDPSDGANGTWTTETALTSARWGKGAFSGLGDSLLYWVGGANESIGSAASSTADVQTYNPSTNAWATAPTDYPDFSGYTPAGVTGISNSCVSATPAF